MNTAEERLMTFEKWCRIIFLCVYLFSLVFFSTVDYYWSRPLFVIVMSWFAGFFYIYRCFGKTLVKLNQSGGTRKFFLRAIMTFHFLLLIMICFKQMRLVTNNFFPLTFIFTMFTLSGLVFDRDIFVLTISRKKLFILSCAGTAGVVLLSIVKVHTMNQYYADFSGILRRFHLMTSGRDILLQQLGHYARVFQYVPYPFYIFCQRFETVLIVKNLYYILLGGLSFYLFGRLFLEKKSAIILTTAFVLTPTFMRNIFTGLNSMNYIVPIIIAVFYFYEKKHFTGFVISSILTGFVREDIALTIAFFSIIAIIEKRDKKWIIFPAVYCSISLFLYFKVFLSMTHTQQYFIEKQGYYTAIGKTWGERIMFPGRYPVRFLKIMFSVHNIQFLIMLFQTALFLIPLLSVKIIISAPIFAEILLLHDQPPNINNYRALLPLTILFVSTLYALRNLERMKIKNFCFGSVKNHIITGILFMNLCSFYLWLFPGEFSPPVNWKSQQEAVEMVDENSHIIAPVNMLTFFYKGTASDYYPYSFPARQISSGTNIIIDLQPMMDGGIIDPGYIRGFQNVVRSIVSNPEDYKIKFRENGVYLFRNEQTER